MVTSNMSVASAKSTGLLQVELTSESDLFFHFTHTIEEEAFRQHMQQEQRLMVDFDQYPSMFVRMLNSCIQSPQAHIAVLLIEQSGQARLDFIQVCSVGWSLFSFTAVLCHVGIVLSSFASQISTEYVHKAIHAVI